MDLQYNSNIMVRIYYAFTFVVLFLSIGCSKNQETVVVYTSVDQVFSEPVLNDFEEETGIIVNALYDTEETKSTGVLNRLIVEKNNPQCDVFWSGDPMRSVVLKNKNILTPYQSEKANDIKNIYKDPDSYWTGFSARARVLLYNKDLIKREDVPRSIFDLTQEKLKGQVAIANPLFGTTTFHIAALFDVLGDKKARRFLNDLKENDCLILSSNGDVKKQVMKGKVKCGLTDTDDAYEALSEGAHVGIVFLDKEGIGSLIMPNTLCLKKNAPHMENAKKLIDYLLSKKTETKLAISCAQMPLHKGVDTPDAVPSLDGIKAMRVNYDKTTQRLKEIQTYIKEWMQD